MANSKVEEPTIDVKLFVDKEKKKVLFAESDKEFVDVLCSFLTMPLGTIVRILGKQSQMGCLDELYKSVEDLGTNYFQAKACKAMLLAPLNAAWSHCCRLKINVDDTKPRSVYVCRDTNCSAHGDRAFSSFPDTICKCSKAMQSVGDALGNNGNPALSGGVGGPESGVFVQGLLKFIITDDLIVAPASTSLMLSLFEKFGVRDPENIEETILQLGSQKIISLLKRSLVSKQPLTGLYFNATDNAYDDTDLYVLPKMIVLPEQKNDADQKIKVLQTKNNLLLYVEGDAEFIDLLFGLLSIPLGSIINALGQWPPNGCVDNIWKSIDGKGCVRSECQSLLLSPKTAPFGSGAAKVLEVDELAPALDVSGCFKCLKTCGFANISRCHQRYYCGDMVKTTQLCELNPKAPKGGSGNGETYVKGGLMKFIVTGDLHIRPLSLSSTLQVLCDANVQIEEIEEREISLTKFQIMEIQRAALMGRAALTTVLLLPNNPKKKRKAES
ncbi:unnamed protein product [Urochloa humidicola]